ncbi:hypothetical protein QLQ12_37775 [Actinoplanes sp. NEAU-A12]|uniref:Flavin reductase n=1 Tax=Actinoplanes sandaracinus TaxID=3045177 RepID=A0ABT6WX92_9ACTN|nr:hypothetical protein [Actinoplanes sandaracinus]MDI6104356.1 hypothetical protein [Actinoplanes sandaracinus]
MTVLGLHRASRPSWRCEDCGKPWPCPERQAMLLDERPLDRMAALLFMAKLMYEAIEDFTQDGTGPVPDLYERFLGFLRPAEPDPAGGTESEGVADEGP